MTSKVIAGAVSAALSAASARPDNGLKLEDVASVAEEVTAAVAPIVAHVTNTEPWYQSRVTLGSMAGLIISTMGLYGLISSGVTDKEMYVPLLGTWMTSAVTLYGRWVARRPLGA